MAWRAQITQVQESPVYTDSVSINVRFFEGKVDAATREFTKEFKLASIHFQTVSDVDSLIEAELQRLTKFDNAIEIIKQRIEASKIIRMARPTADVFKDTVVAPATVGKEKLAGSDLQVSTVTADPDLTAIADEFKTIGG